MFTQQPARWELDDRVDLTAPMHSPRACSAGELPVPMAPDWKPDELGEDSFKP